MVQYEMVSDIFIEVKWLLIDTDTIYVIAVNYTSESLFFHYAWVLKSFKLILTGTTLVYWNPSNFFNGLAQRLRIEV